MSLVISPFLELDTLATVTGRGASTSNAVTLSSSANHYMGHFYYDPYDAAGNHYPHFNDGNSASGSKINWRLFTGGTNSVTHTWTTSLATFATNIAATNFSGSHSGTSSGTNTGDQTIPTTLPNANAITFNSSGGAAAGSTYTGAAVLTVDYATVGAAAAGHTHSYQAADADLLAIGGLTGTTGLLKKTAADTWTLDTTAYYHSGNVPPYPAEADTLATVTGRGATTSTTVSLNGGIASYMGDTGVLFQSYNASAANAAQLSIKHSLGSVTVANARGALNIGVGDVTTATITLQSDYSNPVILQRSAASGKGALILRGSDTIGTAIEFGRSQAATDWGTYLAFSVHDNNISDALLSLKEKVRINAIGMAIGTATSVTGYNLTLGSATNTAKIIQYQTAIQADINPYVVGGIDLIDVPRDGVVSNPAAYMRFVNKNTNAGFATAIRGLDITFGTVNGANGQGTAATERMRITTNGGIAFNGASNHGSSGQVLQSNGDAAPTWVANVTSIAATSPIVTSAATGAITLSHDASGVTAGTYNNVTVNVTGHVTAGSNVAYYHSGNVPPYPAEADTLATVTGRGATTTTAVILNGGLSTGTASTGVTRGMLTTEGNFLSYYAAETTARIQLGRDVGGSGSAGLALGGSTYALIAASDTSGTALYFKLSAAAATASTSPNMALTATGLGIGTTAPSGKLHAYISATAQMIFQNSSQNNLYISGTNASVIIDSTGSSYPSYVIRTQGVTNGMLQNILGAAASGIALTNASGNGIVVDSNGKVGIGTASPLAPLHVFYAPAANTTVDDVVRITSKYNAATGASAIAGSGPAIVFSGGIGDNQTRDRARIVAVYEASNMSGLSFHTQSTADIVTERMRLTINGGVSFGSTGTAYGTSGQVLQSNGNASPTWVAHVTSIAATSPIVASASTGAITLSHAASGVSAGTYNNVTVNATGHVTAGSNAGYLTGESDTLATVTARGSIATNSISTPAGDNIGYGFWGSNDTYGSAMGASAAYVYGPVTDYSIKTFMSNNTGRGFTWGVKGSTPIAALEVTTGNMRIAGTFSAASKSFLIPHPTKPGMELRYGSLEGPENGVYVRGRLKGNKIELPEYWTKLVDPDSITVNLTAIGKSQNLYVEDIKDNVVYVGGKNVNCFYTVYAERVDIAKLEVEIG